MFDIFSVDLCCEGFVIPEAVVKVPPREGCDGNARRGASRLRVGHMEAMYGTYMYLTPAYEYTI